MKDVLRALGSSDADEARSALSLRILDLASDSIERALPLHVLALLEFEHGDPEGARGLLVETADVERAAGLESVALHTSHQIALVTQNGATVARVGRYYQGTYETLTRMRNRQGAALCLKSMAEMYLAHGRIPGALELLRRSVQLLDACSDPAAPHLRAWESALQG